MSVTALLRRKIEQHNAQKLLIKGIRTFDIAKVKFALESGAEISTPKGIRPHPDPLKVAIDFDNAEALAEMLKTERGSIAAALGHYDIVAERSTKTYLPLPWRSRTRSYLLAAAVMGKQKSALVLAQCPYIDVEDSGHLLNIGKTKVEDDDLPIFYARKNNMASVVNAIEERLKQSSAISKDLKLSDSISLEQTSMIKPRVEERDQLGHALAEAFTSSGRVNGLERKNQASEALLKRIEKLEDEVQQLSKPTELDKPRFSIPKARP